MQKSKQKRWFILQGKMLFWFKLEAQRAPNDQLRKTAQNSMFVHRQRIQSAPADSGAKGFPILISPEHSKEKPYELVAPSQVSCRCFFF